MRERTLFKRAASIGKPRFSTYVHSLVNDLEHPAMSIATRSPSELCQMAKALRLDPSKLAHTNVALAMTNWVIPKQITFELMKQMITDVSTNGSDDFYKKVQLMHARLMGHEAVVDLMENHEALCEKNAGIAAEVMEVIAEEQTVTHEVRNTRLFKHMMNEIREGRLSLNTDDFFILQKAMQDTLTTYHQNKLIGDVVSHTLRQSMESGEIKPLPMKPTGESRYIILAGHPGSGKGYLTRLALEQSKTDFSQFCRLTPDDYHHTLANIGPRVQVGSDEKEHALVYWELMFPIMDGVKETLAKRHQQIGMSPDVLQESLVVSAQRLRDCGKNGQKISCYVTVHHNLPHVLAGVEKRFEETRRFVKYCYVRHGKRDVAQHMSSAFSEALSEGLPAATIQLYNTMFIHDKAHEKPKVPVVSCDYEGQKVLVFNLDDFIRFDEAKQMNIDDEPMSLPHDEDIVSSFLEAYKQSLKSFVFIDPKITEEQSKRIEDHIYAHINEEGHLVIDDTEVFQRVVNESVLTRVFFNQISQRMPLDTRPLMS